mmetsp:Transcript_30349/g.34877  ORF Transcript_30349/g.34877 Transcript_30349/m.34877 type:complete len:193 (-) Transcript_30349:87-665(-)
MMQSQSQSQSLLVLSFLLCLATTTILSKTINIVSNSNEIVKVVLSNSHRKNYVLAEALTPQYQPSAVGASRRTSTASLSISSIELPFSSTTIGHPHHHRPHKGKGNDTAVAEKTKKYAAVGITTNTNVDPFLLHLLHHHNQHHHCQSHSLSTAATSSSSSSSTASTTAVTATHFAYQRPRYGSSSSRRLQRR